MNTAVILAHGFTQTARSWHTVTPLLESHGYGPVTAVDLPGHGTADTIRGDLWQAADHLVSHGGAGTYVGYSMGGRVSLHAALAHPNDVEQLILIGATAGFEAASHRATRRAHDEALADRLEEIGVEAFIDTWLTNPLFAGLTVETAQRADRITNTAAGLASSLRSAGTGTQVPLWDRLESIAVPVLLLVGEHDAKFRSIAERMRQLLPNATLSVIDDAGHSVHLEQPEATVDAIASWWTLT